MFKHQLGLKASYYFMGLLSLVLFGSFITMVSSNAFAHKVNIFAYVEGDMVHTESYFPDGRKVEGAVIEVYDSQGNKLLEGKTNKEGLFDFKIPKKDDLKIVLIASMGHRNSYTLSASEMAEAGEPQEAQLEEPEEVREQTTTAVAQLDLDQIKRIIDASLDEKLKPIVRQLAKAEQRGVSFTEVMGGIGYIFGIMGLIMYFSSRRKSGR
jgi:nickel transport protein